MSIHHGARLLHLARPEVQVRARRFREHEVDASATTAGRDHNSQHLFVQIDGSCSFPSVAARLHGKLCENSFKTHLRGLPRGFLCKQYTVRAHVFLMRILSACESQPVVTVVQVHTATESSTDPTHRVAQESRSTLCVSCSKTATPHRAMSYVTLHLTTPSTCTPSLSSTLASSHGLHPPLSEHKPCGDPRPHLSGALAKPPSFTGYEPKQLAENQDHRQNTEDKQFAEHEDLRVKPLFFHQLSIASTYDSAESIVTLPSDTDLDDVQIRALLASPLYTQEREANADRSQVYHLSGNSCDISP